MCLPGENRNALEVMFKRDLLEDSVSVHVIVPAQPCPYIITQPLRAPSPVSDPSLWDSVNSSHPSLEAPWEKFPTGVYERRLSPQSTPVPEEFFGCVQLMLGRKGWAGIKLN